MAILSTYDVPSCCGAESIVPNIRGDEVTTADMLVQLLRDKLSDLESDYSDGLFDDDGEEYEDYEREEWDRHPEAFLFASVLPTSPTGWREALERMGFIPLIETGDEVCYVRVGEEE